MKVDIKLKDKILKESGETTGIVFNFQQFSIQDGPGLRTTMFVKDVLFTVPGVQILSQYIHLIRLRRFRINVAVAGHVLRSAKQEPCRITKIIRSFLIIPNVIIVWIV